MPSLIASLGLNISRFSQGLRQAEGEAKKHGHSIAASLGEGLSEKLKEVGSVVAVEEVIRRTLEYADKIGDAGKRTGIAVEALQAWDMALQQSGASLDDAIPFFEKLAVAKQKALKGDEQAIESFAKFGVSIDQLKSKRVEVLGLQIAKAFEKGDPQALIADLRELGGKGVGALAAAFREGLAGAVEENKKAVSIMSQETIEKLKSVGDTFKSLWAEVRGGIGTIVAPALEFLIGKLVYLKDLVAIVSAAAGGFSVGGLSGARQAAADYQKQIDAREAKKHEEKKVPFFPHQEESPSKKDQREAQSLKSKDETVKTGPTPHNKDLNALQQIGAYASAPEQQTVLDLSRRQERHLDTIRKNSDLLAQAIQSDQKGVKF